MLIPRPEPETLRRYARGELGADDVAVVESWIRSDASAASVMDTIAATGKGSEPRRTRSDPRNLLRPPEAADEMGRLGEYRVLGILGRGGMGVVFRAEDVRLSRLVALKVIEPTFTAEPEVRARFLREARLAARVSDDHVVPIYAVGEADGVLYLAMPLLQGESLADRLKRDGRLPPGDLVRFAAQAAHGLAAAHGKGLIHRDIKPGNLWIEPTPSGERIKILDFGLARPAGESGETLTETGFVPGTPPYMSPEQVRAEAIDARSDLFSLGAVLYEAATGQRAFPGVGSFQICRHVVDLTPFRPRDITPDIPPDVSDLIMHLLAKDPANRPAVATAVAAGFAATLVATPLPVAPARTSRRTVWAPAAILIAALAVLSAIVIPRGAGDPVNPLAGTPPPESPRATEITPPVVHPADVIPVVKEQIRAAIVVGVNEYDHLELGTLAYAESDARELAKVLQERGFEVRLFLGSAHGSNRATGENIRKAVAESRLLDGPSNLLLIALSGTGHEYPVVGTKETAPVFCPVDADPYEPKSLIPVLELIGPKDGPTVIVLSDACRSFIDKTRERSATRAAPAIREGAVVFFACRRGQFAVENASEKHGIFSGAVIAELEGKGWSSLKDELHWETLVDSVENRVKGRAGPEGQATEVVGTLPPGFVLVPRKKTAP